MLTRYSVIDGKNSREIVLLRGTGCDWRKCRFCNYHSDKNPDPHANYLLNRSVLENVTGRYGKLEVINSGSFTELDEPTLQLLETLCAEKNIGELHFECHWLHRDAVPALRARFAAVRRPGGVAVKIKTGVETFDALFRECYLSKGIGTADPAELAAFADEVCLLFGLPGQTAGSMTADMETGLRYFERVCVNIMVENGMPVKPDPAVIDIFRTQLYPRYAGNPRVDILMENTGFGVGELSDEK